MSNGAHTLELAAFIDAGGIIEGARSTPLRVTVTGVAAGQTSSIVDGDITTTTDGVRLRLDVLYDALVEPSSLAVTGDGRVLVGGHGGGVVTVGPNGVTESLPAGTGAVLAIALSPTHARDGFVYLTHAVDGDGGAPDLKVWPTGEAPDLRVGPTVFRTDTVFRTARYRGVRSRLAERMVVLEHGPSSAEPAAALRVGPDGKLYAAFDNGGQADAPRPISDWSGTLLRMELDGRTPDDQPAASPVMWTGLQSPRGFDWAPGGSALWIADASSDGVERLRVIGSTADRPRRAAQRGAYVLPRGLGAAGVAFYGAGAVEEFSGDLFVAGRDAGYILRIRFDDTGRPVTTERLLEGSAGTVRALAMSTDGAIYFCTDTLLARLRRVN